MASPLRTSTGFSTRRVQRAIETAYVDVHLDGILVEDEDSTPVYALHESDDKPPEAQIEQREFVEAMHRCIDSLDDREREIICRYYGFGGALPMTLEEIGSLLGLTRERIRQLRDRGLSKMRAEHGELLTELSRN